MRDGIAIRPSVNERPLAERLMLLEEGLSSLQARIAGLEEDANLYNSTTAQQAVLKWLLRHKCVTAPVLAYETGHSQVVCRKAISLLHKQGYIVRVNGESNVGMYTKNPARRYLG